MDTLHTRDAQRTASPSVPLICTPISLLIIRPSLLEAATCKEMGQKVVAPDRARSLQREGEYVLTVGGVTPVPFEDSPPRAHGELHCDGSKEVPAQMLTLAPAGPLLPKPPCRRSHTNREGT